MTELQKIQRITGKEINNDLMNPIKAIDLFEHYTEQTEPLKSICDKHQEKMLSKGFTYKRSAKFLKAVEKIGYTFDYGLCAEPYNLRLIGTEIEDED